MKKILMLTMCLALVPMLFASKRDLEHAELDADVAPGLKTPAARMIRVCPSPERAIRPTPTRAQPTSRQEDTLYYDNMTNVNAIGMSTTGYHWGAAVRFTTTELAPYAGYNLIAVVVFRAAYTTTNDSIIVYGQGTPILPGPVVSAQTWMPTISTWNRIDLVTPVAINGTDDIWIADMHTESPGGFPSGVGPGPYVVGKGSWVSDSGAWYELGPLGLDYNWNIWAIVEPAGPAGLTFDFEDGWQGWTHTNGQPFPAGWERKEFDYQASYAVPDAGDTSMWIDSDAMSGTWVQDTALSPILVPNPTMDWLKYGAGYNDVGSSDFYEVGIKYFDGSTWNAVPLVVYTADFFGDWDSVDVSAYAGYSQIQVYFYYDDMDSWAWYAVFDNVSIDAHFPTAAIVWDFETGWQDWTHTNGQVFPAAWGVQPSGIHTPCPDPGVSSMWIDSDASGGGYSDSALSPLLVPNPTMDWLNYGFYNYGGSGSYINELRVGIKHFTSGVWNVVELAYYPAGVTSGPGWDSVDVSAYATADMVQIYFYHDDLGTWGYYSAFDNVSIDATIYTADHDVGCSEVVSPSAGGVPAADYDVIGRIQNFGGSIETFDVTANVFDTVGMAQVFTQTVTLTDFPVAGDSNVNFGTVTFAQDSAYYTEIYTLLAGDTDPSNDTSAILSWTGMTPGEIVFELDAEAITGDIRLLGVEFDGEYFYVTGATDMTQTKVYVIDTAGTLMHSYNQPAHSTSWGWRDIAWDYVYRGPDRIDTLYSSVNNNVDKWGYDFVGDSLIYYGSFPGPENPNRGLAYDGDDDWFFTANFSSNCYKFDKTNPNIQNVVNTYAMYGAAYDAGHPTTDGPWVWWHSQDDLGGTGYLLTIHQMEPVTMAFTGYFLAPVPTMSATGTAGGLCYWSDFRGMDVLFGMNQGTPDHIFGVYVRTTPTGIEDEPGVGRPSVFGFAPMTNPTKGSAISYITTTQGNVSLKVYDGTGRLVETLVNSVQPAGVNTVNWDTRNIANGVYFFKLEAENQHATHKLILIK